ncbi:hypothetical protein ACFXKW_33295 [Streptomyces sp. NPDC059193]|uniref:hypothetical protein n=1 Tax=Streptomyces sp. NPDC059193 TaxID=3346763 RepID=UPI00369D7687
MTENGQGSGPQPGAPWGPEPAYGYPQHPQDPQQQPPQEPPQPQPQPSPGHVVGPGYEGPGDPHGYGYPPLPEAVTQYIPPVPAAPAHGEAATQYIPPVPAAPAASAHEEAATQYIPPVPAAPAHGEAATQYLPPVPAAPAHEEAATQYLPPVPAGPAAGGPGPFDGLFRSDAPPAAAGGAPTGGHAQHLPPVPPRSYPPRGQRPVPPPQQHHPQQQPHHQQPHHQQPHQNPQFAPPQPPPPPEAPRKVSPAIIGAVVIGLAVAGLGVGSLLGNGKPQNNDPAAVPPTTAASGGSAAPAGEAPVDPGRPQAVQLDKLLADSNDSRAAVIKAVEDIKSCNKLDQAASDLRDAARQREELVTRLQELKVDQLPDHAKLTAALTKAWQSSANADNSYAAWADDVDDDKCKDGKAKSTDNAVAGNKASGEATKAKDSAATLWNRIAAKYALTKRDKSQL